MHFALVLKVIRANPLASVISIDDKILPFVTPLPLQLLDLVNQMLFLDHCDKLNLHWRYSAARPTAVVTFMGSHAYVAPRVYRDLARVPP